MTRFERPERPAGKRPANSRGSRGSRGTRGGAPAASVNGGNRNVRKKPSQQSTAPREFTLPQTLTPALPAVESFDALEMPAALAKTLTAQGVTEPFPIQGATLPN